MAGRRGNNEGNIVQRSDRRCMARISLPDGKLASAIRDRDKGITIVVDGRQTLEQYLLSWLDMTRPAVKPKTYRIYEMLMRVHVMPSLEQLA